MKKLYSLVNNLLGTTPENQVLDCNSHSDQAKSFTDIFMGKLDKIRSDLEDHPKYQPPVRDVP